METILILDNIRSTHNVGSIFRTADAAGVSQLYLVGITPTPVDRFGRLRPEIAKTALGATETVSWEQIGDETSLSTEAAVRLIERLRSDGYQIVAVEQAPNAVSLFDFSPTDKMAYILGAEVEGVQPEVLAAADVTVEIPMRGMKESLNVSVTAGIVLFQK